MKNLLNALCLLLGFVVVFAWGVNAYALDGCPDNYAPLKSTGVCVPAAKNLTRLDKRVNACVSYALTTVQTEAAAKALPKVCADLVLGGQDYKDYFDRNDDDDRRRCRR